MTAIDAKERGPQPSQPPSSPAPQGRGYSEPHLVRQTPTPPPTPSIPYGQSSLAPKAPIVVLLPLSSHLVLLTDTPFLQFTALSSRSCHFLVSSSPVRPLPPPPLPPPPVVSLPVPQLATHPLTRARAEKDMAGRGKGGGWKGGKEPPPRTQARAHTQQSPPHAASRSSPHPTPPLSFPTCPRLILIQIRPLAYLALALAGAWGRGGGKAVWRDCLHCRFWFVSRRVVGRVRRAGNGVGKVYVPARLSKYMTEAGQQGADRAGQRRQRRAAARHASRGICTSLHSPRAGWRHGSLLPAGPS